MGKLWFLMRRYFKELAFEGLQNYLIPSCVDKVMANLLKTVQNTSKLGAVLNSGLYEKTGIDWLIEKWWFLVRRYINELSIKFFLKHLNWNSVEKVMLILLRVCRLNWNYARLYSTLILGTLLHESCFVSKINIFADIKSFSYWGFTSYVEVGSER